MYRLYLDKEAHSSPHMTGRVRAEQIRVVVKQTRAFFVLKHQNVKVLFAVRSRLFTIFLYTQNGNCTTFVFAYFNYPPTRGSLV